jgi:hypothetical protein
MLYFNLKNGFRQSNGKNAGRSEKNKADEKNE